jgi:hypothetical protein
MGDAVAGIDFPALRKMISIAQVLELLDFVPTETHAGSGPRRLSGSRLDDLTKSLVLRKSRQKHVSMFPMPITGRSVGLVGCGHEPTAV